MEMLFKSQVPGPFSQTAFSLRFQCRGGCSRSAVVFTGCKGAACAPERVMFLRLLLSLIENFASQTSSLLMLSMSIYS